jgi:anti-sigma regulatory factor (Ser/Thr protein kinase)
MAVWRLSVPAYHREIEDICNLVGQAAADAGFGARTIYACQLAIGEACENIITHGYKQEGLGEIELAAYSSSGRLTIRLCDSAPPFNPSLQPEAPNWKDGNPPIGGLGLLIIHRVMDDVKYQRRGNRNCLRLIKKEKLP